MVQLIRSGLFLLLVTCVTWPCSGQKTWMVHVPTSQGKVVGKLMAWDTSKFLLLGRDGQLHEFDISLSQQSPRYDNAFEPLSHLELKGQLQREFGSRFEVSATKHYMVVHPRGQRKLWTERFEQLYREMIHYFSARGISLSRPQFPLVAIVFPSRSEFTNYMHKTDVDLGYALAGFYAFASNRVALYDSTGGDENQDWRYNAATVVHEAAHQTAYNTGVHSRFTPPPQLLSEGIGTLFEAPGVYAAQTYRSLKDRINQEQLEAFRSSFPDGVSPEALTAIITDDSVFRADATAAYALSWAFTFSMAEKQPSRLADYLRRTAAKPAFTHVSKDQRLSDFQSVFGNDMVMVTTRLNRFIKDLP